MGDALLIRRWTPEDSASDLTALLHRAYARLGAMGLNYTAVDVSVEDVARRAAQGLCIVGEREGRVVATLTLSRGDSGSLCAWYRRPEVASVHRFAVDPMLQGRGVGTRLLRWAEDWARGEGFAEIALDTAKTATHLVAYYGARGFRTVEDVQWPGKRYVSAIFSKSLA